MLTPLRQDVCYSPETAEEIMCSQCDACDFTLLKGYCVSTYVSHKQCRAVRIDIHVAILVIAILVIAIHVET